MMILALVLGVFSWTFLEYVVHRWLGHDSRFRPNFFASEHTRHHSQGNYFAPAVKKIVTAPTTRIGIRTLGVSSSVRLIYRSAGPE